MKNKKIKITLAIAIPLVIVIAIVILMILGIIPNPFLDTSDLVCTRNNLRDDEIVTFKFNWLSKSIYSKSVIYLYFDNKEDADDYYNNYVLDKSNSIREDDTTIILNTVIENEKEYYGESRKEIKKLYTQFGYNCE